MNSQISVAFIASTLSAIMFGVLAGQPPSSPFYLSGASFYAAIAVICVVLPVIGIAILRLKPSARDWAWGVGLSPLPGTIAFLLAALWMGIS